MLLPNKKTRQNKISPIQVPHSHKKAKHIEIYGRPVHGKSAGETIEILARWTSEENDSI